MATVAPNVVVAPAPDPPGFYPNYASRSSFALGGVQIGAGVIALLLFMIVLAEGEESQLWGYLSGGIQFIAAGALGIAAGQVKNACQIIAFMVLSILAAVCAVLQTIGHAAVPPDHEDRAVVYILGIVFLIESIASIWSAVICCRTVCCGRQRNQRVTAGFQTQTGQVIMTTAQMALQPVYGMSSTPYPWEGAPPGYTGDPVPYEDSPPKC